METWNSRKNILDSWFKVVKAEKIHHTFSYNKGEVSRVSSVTVNPLSDQIRTRVFVSLCFEQDDVLLERSTECREREADTKEAAEEVKHFRNVRNEVNASLESGLPLLFLSLSLFLFLSTSLSPPSLSPLSLSLTLSLTHWVIKKNQKHPHKYLKTWK